MCRVWRCAMGIAAGQVVWAPLCRGDLRLGRVACVPRVALCPGDCCWPLCRGDLRLGHVATVACVALPHGDCCWAGRVGGGVLWGSASRARRVCGVGAAVPWGLLLGVLRGWRCAVGVCVSGASRVWRGCRCAIRIAVGRVAWVPLCHGDRCWARRMGGGVPWVLLLGMSRGCRCAMVIAARRVACVALCHGDCCWVCREGGAVPWGLLLGRSRGRRCAMRIAVGRVAWAPLSPSFLGGRRRV